ncbi:MAG: asparagine synthase (glutamine-hydrolyzing) [Methylacidiphilales bacterium]|nr:asparagine synthase (glutamine-hydrolyzing) [Candidatus Methylacidiphilales bacterium]
MCGIAGAYFYQSTARALKLATLRHRGPDSEGEWTSSSGRVWFGHTRLAIMDLSPTGAQPMLDPQTSNCIVFNGEIYNHLELRKLLTAKGENFRGTSDTETLLLAYQHWGESMLSRLKGMFAFAIYDAARDAIWLARDRFGIKPLYYHHSEYSCCFASEIRCLTSSIPGIKQPTQHTAAAYLQSGCCPHHTLLFPDIHEFPVASSQWIDKNGPDRFRKFWQPSLPLPRQSPPSRQEAAQEIRRLLDISVREHLNSDVPISTMLSGGIDSSIITALASRHMPGKINTFSVGFRETELDESAYAQMIADQYQTRHHHIILDENEVLKNVQEAIGVMDLPTVDAINTYIVVREVAKAGYKVVLSGLGGDELFGGYPQFLALPRLKYLAYAPRILTEFMILMGKARHLLRDIPVTADAAMFDLWWRRIWGSYLLQQCNLPTPHFQIDEPPDHFDEFTRISWVEIRHYMRDMLLRDCDQMSMSVSLELRVPYLDHKLVEYALSLPGTIKSAPGETKALLVESCRDLIPETIYDRPKMGFALPMDKWIRGPLNQFSMEGLQYAQHQLDLDPDKVNLLLDSFSKRKLHWSRLWALIVLGWYLHNSRKMPSILLR